MSQKENRPRSGSVVRGEPHEVAPGVVQFDRYARVAHLDPARAQEAARPPASPADSEACRAARAEAAFRAGRFSASEEEIRTARHNAALACGQPPPADIVVVRP